MEEKLRCQSCGMPLGEGFYGTEADGSETNRYCNFCYQKGAFTNPDMTLEEMVQSSVDNMTQDLHFSEEKAKELANTFIPKLKRWNKKRM